MTRRDGFKLPRRDLSKSAIIEAQYFTPGNAVIDTGDNIVLENDDGNWDPNMWPPETSEAINHENFQFEHLRNLVRYMLRTKIIAN